MFLQSVSTAAMEKALSATWQRAQLISTNIANEDTPGYKAKRLSFEAALRSEIQRTRDDSGLTRRQQVAGIDRVKPTVYEDTSTIGRADGNNVDLVAEQAEYVRVQLQYQALAQKISSYYSNMKYAISGGR